MCCRTSPSGTPKKNIYTPEVPVEKQIPRYDGNLALHAALREGNLKEAKDFLDRHPHIDLSQKDSEGLTPWDHANLSDDRISLPLLIKFKFENLWGKIIAIFDSIFSKLQTLGVVRLLQESSMDYSQEIETDLQRAAFEGDLEALKRHCTRKTLDQQTKRGFSALHFAAAAGNQESLLFLLEMGARRDLLSDDRKTALHMAALNDKCEAADFLIRCGFNIDEPDISGSTPLHFAMMKEGFKTAKMLIQRGANTEKQNLFDLDPLKAFAGGLKIRTDCRDELSLSSEDLQLFSTIALSKTIHFAGFSTIGSFFDFLNELLRNGIGFKNANNLGRAGFLARGITQLTAAGLGLFGFTQTAAALGIASLYGDIASTAWNTFAIAKRSLRGIANAWKHSRYEVFRPIRNAIVHVVNGADSASRAYSGINGDLEAIKFQKICSEFASKDQCLASGKLDPSNPEHAKWILGLSSNDCDSAKMAVAEETKRLSSCSDDQKAACSQVLSHLTASQNTICSP